jgi:SpoVK/Ycf46/Vps4 family AAA+-type ATPase
MSLKHLRCELRWERPESELGLHADLTIARMLLALPARRKVYAMNYETLGNHWEFSRLAPGPQPRPDQGAAPTLVVNFKADECDVGEEYFATLDFDEVADQAGDFWPNRESLRSLVAGGRSAGRLERFLRAVIADRETALSRLDGRPFEARLIALQERLHLSATDVAILRFCALVRHDADVREVAGTFQQVQSAARAATIAAALEVPVNGFVEATRSRSGLARFGLLDRQAPDLTEVDSNPLAALLDGLREEGGGGRDPLAGIMLPVPASERVDVDFSHLRIPIEALQAAIEQAWVTGRRGCNLLLHGAPGHGKTQIARLLAGNLAAAAFEVPVEDDDGEPRPGDSRARSAVLCQHALAELERSLLVFDEAEDLFPVPSLSWLFDAKSRPQKGWINSLLEGTQVPTIWIANEVGHIDPAILRRFDLILEVPAPPRATRSRLLDHALSQTPVSARWREQLLGLEDLSPAELQRLSKAHAFAPKGQTMETFLRNVFEEARKAGGQSVHAGEVLLPSRYSLDTVNADADLDGVARQIQRTGRARLCLYGPPGSGKTAYVQHLAQRLGRPLHVKRASDLLGSYVGQTERQLAEAFDCAKREGAVLLIDEVDSFLQDRERAERNWEVTGVNELLTQMERYEGVLAMCTNRFRLIDSAALRRFDLKVRFGCLTAPQRLTLFDQVSRLLELPGTSLQWEAAHARLNRLDRLTPGAFETASRRHEFAPFANVIGLVDALDAEQVSERALASE